MNLWIGYWTIMLGLTLFALSVSFWTTFRRYRLVNQIEVVQPFSK